MDAGGYRMAWVGTRENDENKTISPVVHAGFEDGFLQRGTLTWADNERGRRPVGTAIRTGKTAIARNIQVDPNMVAWRDEALKRGYASTIALPILLNGGVFGSLAIYAEEPDAFDPAEVKLLTELTEDLAYGIQALRTKADLRMAAEALQREKAFTDAVIESFPDVFFVIQATGKFLHWGRNPEKVLGYSREETMAMESALEIVAEDDRPLAARAIEEAFARGRTAVEVHLLHRDGRKIPYLVRATRAVIGEATYMVGLGLDISERKKAEDALKESEALFRTTFENAGIGIALVDVNGRPVQSNPALEKIIGYTAAELSRMTFTEFTHPDDRERDWDLYFEMMEGKRDKYAIEKRYLRKDGRLVWGLLTVSLVRDLQGRPEYAVGMVQDITERKQAEEALRRSEAALKEALLAAEMGVWNWTVVTDTVTWDENLYRIAGQDANLPAPRYQELSRCYTPESWARLKSAVENALSTGTPYVLDLEMLRPDGSKRWLISRGEPVRDASGSITQLRGTVQDITERMLAERRVREGEERFRKAFMTGADASYIATLKEGKLVEANARFYEVFGYSQEEMAGKTAQELGLYVNPEDRQKAIDEVMSKGLVRELEVEGRKKDGTLITVLLSINLLKWGDEPLILGAITDITARKKAEEALRASEARLKDAEKLAQLGSSSWDVATDTTTWSDGLYRIVGRDRQLPPPKHHERAAIYTPESWDRLDIAVRQALAAGVPYELDLEVVRPDGTKRHVLARGVAERGADGRVARLHGTLQDITERRKLEQQFRQAQKMEAVGRLAGGVAHDFNNLLTVINGYSEMALESMSRDDPKRTYMSEISKAGERAAGLTRQLLAFSRQQVLAPRVLDLNAVVVDMEKMLRRLIGEDIDLAVVQGSALGQVKADPGQIEQIIMNLVVNARDAMPRGGKLAIATNNAELDENDIEKVSSVIPGRYVMFAISDSGTGMDSQTQAHIFEPFFTTKEQGKGTGLGLATVYGIVKQSGGYISVDSVPGQGTTFKIYLPRVDEPSEPFIPSEGDARPLGGSETILLVEDERELRLLAARALQAQGYRVLESASPEEALQMSSQEQGRIHLLLTDVVMPGMSGRKVAEQIATLHPNMKVLYMSGYTDDSVFRNGVLEMGTAFLQKPFTPSSLARKVREILNEQKPA